MSTVKPVFFRKTCDTLYGTFICQTIERRPGKELNMNKGTSVGPGAELTRVRTVKLHTPYVVCHDSSGLPFSLYPGVGENPLSTFLYLHCTALHRD